MKVDSLAVDPAGDDKLVIEFALARGGYATTVLRELLRVTEGDARVAAGSPP